MLSGLWLWFEPEPYIWPEQPLREVIAWDAVVANEIIWQFASSVEPFPPSHSSAAMAKAGHVSTDVPLFGNVPGGSSRCSQARWDIWSLQWALSLHWGPRWMWHPGGILIRRLNYFNWQFSLQRGSEATPSYDRTSKLSSLKLSPVTQQRKSIFVSTIPFLTSLFKPHEHSAGLGLRFVK